MSEVKTDLEIQSLDKEATTEWLRPKALLDEIEYAKSLHYDIVIGETEDQAYEHPELIHEIYDYLDEGGRAYQSIMGKLDTGRAAVISTLAQAPHRGVRHWAHQQAKKRERQAETARELILYGKSNVQAQPWHRQGGKALALGTIVDAHDLAVAEADELGYPTMSGRLTEAILEHTFSEHAGELAGKTLREATEHAFKLRGKSDAQATDLTNEEFANLETFLATPAQADFKKIVSYCTDSLGIRSRKEEVRQAINEHVAQSEKDEFLMMSIGCGTALPMLEVVKDLRDKGRHAKLILIDQDPIALAAAEQFTHQFGLADVIEMHCKPLFEGKGLRTRVTNLAAILDGRKLDVCEDSGLREYFPDFLYKDLTRQAWEALTDDGLMTTGNMNVNRPQKEFLHGLMGWPIPVQMRHIRKIAGLHEEAGVPHHAMQLRVTQDGVYTLCFSRKSKS